MLKKLLICTLAALLLAGTALAYDNNTHGLEHLPPEVSGYLAGASAWEGWEIADWINPGGSKQSGAFVSLHREKENVLLLFRWRDDAWDYDGYVQKALPQKAQPVLFQEATEGGEASCFLMTCTVESKTICTTWFYNEAKRMWRLDFVCDEFNDNELAVFPDKVKYRGHDTNRTWKTVYGVVETDLRYFSLSAFPTSLAEARAKLSNPPSIPEGELQAREVAFRGGRTYEVLTGPGLPYRQAGGGKAKVSTNDWIQVFGREGEWIMIQYDITSSRMRIGWIHQSALPDAAAAQALDFQPQGAYALRQTALTDDPLFSQNTVAVLPAGATLHWLSSMGDWAYVDAVAGDERMRGFVKAADVSVTMPEGAPLAMNLLTEVYGYTLQEAERDFTFHTGLIDGGFRVTFHPTAEPGWIYTADYTHARRLTDSHTPFGSDHEGYPGESAVRDGVRRLQASGADAQAITAHFTACYGPRENWDACVITWHDNVVAGLAQKD